MRRKTDVTVSVRSTTHTTAKTKAKSQGQNLTHFIDRMINLGMIYAETPAGKRKLEEMNK